MSLNYCLTDLPAHEILECNTSLKGGISAVGFLANQNSITDYTSAAQIASAIANGDLKVVKDIKGEVPDASPVEGENLRACGPENVLDSFDRSLTYMDGAVTDTNITFYNALNRWNGWLVWYNCYEQTLTVVNTNVNVNAFNVVPNSKKLKQMWKVSIKWDSLDAPAVYDASTLTQYFE